MNFSYKARKQKMKPKNKKISPTDIQSKRNSRLAIIEDSDAWSQRPDYTVYEVGYFVTNSNHRLIRKIINLIIL